MPLLTAAPISALAVELLTRQLVLINTVERVPAGEYAGPSGGTVTVRVPESREAHEQTTPGAEITLDAISEHAVEVAVRHLYNATLVTDEDLSLTLQDFGTQVLAPMTDAVARAAEDQLADQLNALDADTDISFAAAPDADADLGVLLAIRKTLTDNGAPQAGRTVAVSSDVANRLLSVPTIVQADKRGATTALDAAVIGEVFGLQIVESAAIEDGSAVGYHRSGFAFASATPADPGGGAQVQNSTAGNVTARLVIDFSATHLSSVIAMSLFAGCAPITDAGTR